MYVFAKYGIIHSLFHDHYLIWYVYIFFVFADNQANMNENVRASHDKD